MISKRSQSQIFELILDVAREYETIRSVILNGSRADKNVIKDDFQDFDIIYVVKNVEYFVDQKIFPEKFGKTIITQTPDEMDGIWPGNKDKFTYLMLFEDTNRIDLKLIDEVFYFKSKKDSLSVVLLDKDNKYSSLVEPNDFDYVTKAPSEKEFFNMCNEFLWLSTYVAKGLARKQVLYSKHCLDVLLKQELLKILSVKICIQKQSKINFGSFYKTLEKHLDPQTWNMFLKTFTDCAFQNMWNSLFIMYEIFYDSVCFISQNLNYIFNENEYSKVLDYSKSIYAKSN